MFPVLVLYFKTFHFFRYRLIINTKTNLLLYNFEAVNWDYTAPVERESEFVRKTSSSLNVHPTHSHAFSRAQSAMRRGTDLFASRLSTTNIPHEERVRSAPVRKTDSQGIQKHVSRIQSAVVMRKQLKQQGVKSVSGYENSSMQQGMNSNLNADQREIRFFKEGRTRNAWDTVPDSGLVKEKSEIIRQGESNEYNTRRTRVVARSRSAPAHRMRSLPPNERGLTTSSEVNVKVWENKFHFKAKEASKTKARPFSASITAMQHPVETYSDLKLRTFYQQLQFENVLAGRD